ncbi:MAG: M56 family metallopeptidase, partial [Pedobacter sp.]
MDFKIINITSEEWLNAIGITLFHSLWIGIFLSILAAVIILTTRKTNAAFRYQLLAGSLSLFVLAIGYMFYFTLSQEHNHTNQILQPTNQLVHAGVAAESATKSFLFSSKIDDLMGIWSSYSTQIVLIWFLIILAKGVHLVLGLNTVYYLKRNKIFDAGNVWKEKLNSLAIHLGIHQKIEILQSGIAKVPMVVGHLKPVILIPLGLLNSLSTAEVEAILCHELAHIKRRDYLVNVLQNFIEIIFFFNPAVLWVSKLIKAERENCCDDLALTHVSDRRVYVKALLSCQEFQAATPDFAMALTGKSQLVNRVSRMLFNTKSTLNKMEKTVLTLVMAFVF